jgi:hypothetical protein
VLCPVQTEELQAIKKDMSLQVYILTSFLVGLISCPSSQPSTNKQLGDKDSIVKIEMNLSAFGVESDDFPSIDAVIDFSSHKGICVKSFYNPANKGSTYSLTKSEIDSIKILLKIADLEKLKTEYKISWTDQPSSKTKIYTTKKTYVINDYGLEGDYPLKELYKIVYRY